MRNKNQELTSMLMRISNLEKRGRVKIGEQVSEGHFERKGFKKGAVCPKDSVCGKEYKCGKPFKCHKQPSPESSSQHEHGQRKHLHRAKAHVLQLLNDGASKTQQEIADSLKIRPQSLSEMIGKLEKIGVIARTPDPSDKRKMLVTLTEEGKKQAIHFEELSKAHSEEFFAVLTDEEKDTLTELLQKVIDANTKEN